MTTEIKSFSQALPVLAAHGLEPKPAGARLWAVGAQTLDKGGVIRYARELAAKDVAPAQSLESSPPVALSPKMQAIARDYLDARKRSGQAFLAAARYLAEARAAAKHGEWQLFLEATQTTPDVAESLLRVADEAERDSKFADAVRTNFFSPTVAALLSRASTPDAARDRLLNGPTQPTVTEARRIIQEEQPSKIRIDTETATPTPPRICERCGKSWGAPGSMITSEGRLCQDCAAARLSSGQPFAPAPSAINRPDGSPAGGWPPDFDDVQRRFAALDTTLTYDHHRGFIMRERASGAGRVDPNWATVVEHLETRERGRAALAAAPDGLVPQYPDRPAIAARLALHNWHIQSHFGHEGTIWLVRTGKQGGQKNVRDWAAVVAFADQLDGVTTPTPVAHFDPTAAPCEDCGAPSTNKRTIGGVFAHRCDVCAIKATERENADLRAAAQPDPRLTALCEQAEQLGAQINYLATNDPTTVQVVPPPGYQQRPLPCNADDLAMLVERWQSHATPAPEASSSDWWNVGRELRAVQEGIDHFDHVAAIRAAAALTIALMGDVAALALTQAPNAAKLLEAEGYASIAALLRQLAPEASEATA